MKKPTLSCSVCEAPMWKGRGSKSDGTQTCQPCRRKVVRDVDAVRVCVDCGSQYKWRRDARCSTCRYRRAEKRAIENGKICAECPRPAVASGLCSTHHSYKSRATAGRKYPEHTKVCRFCSEEFTTTGVSTEYCSLEHAQRHRYGWTACQDLVVRLKTRVWLGSFLPSRKGSPMVAGQCGYCPTFFVGAAGARYCSDECAGRAAWKRKYDRQGEFSVSAKVRFGVYGRDGWLCQLCGNPVSPDAPVNTPWAPTLDHIVPQSRQLVPDHSPDNLRLAHMWCNALRGDGTNVSDEEFRTRVASKLESMSIAA